MKTLIIAGIRGAAILMTGCIVPGYDHRYSHSSYGYYGDGRYGNGDERYREGYDRPFYRTQNVNRVIVY
jgi:hypothetical protein